MNLEDRALVFATKQHEHQERCNGEPYILHPIRVASKFQDTTLRTIAYLHDVVEDTDTTLIGIRNSFGNDIADAVDALTRRDGEDYMDYIWRLSYNQLAVKVKIADIEDNLRDFIRNNDKECERLSEKISLYRKALQYLEEKVS